MHEIVEEHPLTLDEPKPLIAVQELAEYTVNLICWPWAKTGDYWQVYRDITRSVKERFEEEGLETPYPYHNIRMEHPGADEGGQSRGYWLLPKTRR